jgi:cation diffusion facilitator CzcD-associated flavoprotein CzcO
MFRVVVAGSQRVSARLIPHCARQQGGYGMYKTKAELLDYLGRYAALHGLAPHLTYGAEVTSIGAPCTAGRWRVRTADGVAYAPKVLVVCTGACHEPHTPALAGVAAFEAAGGVLRHSRDFRNGKEFARQRVVVVGSGNSAAELCVELHEAGAAAVTMVVGAPRRVYRLETLGWLHWLEALLTDPEEAIAALHALAPGSAGWAAAAAEAEATMAPLALDLRAHGWDNLGLDDAGGAGAAAGAAGGLGAVGAGGVPRKPTLDVGLLPLLEVSHT